MVEVTNELIYEILKQIEEGSSSLERGQDEIRSELQALRNHSLAIQQDIHNITLFSRGMRRVSLGSNGGWS